MKYTIGLSAFLAILPIAAQQPPTPETEAPIALREKHTLSLQEQRIRVGIITLGKLHQTLSAIQDKASAEAAVAPVLRAGEELRAWAQTFTTLPPLSEEEQAHYEERYLPIIRKLNRQIKRQGERLASAEYYGSMNLAGALVRIVHNNQ